METLNLRTLNELDGGRMAAALDRVLAMAVLDVRDRPQDKSKRKVTLAITVALGQFEPGGALETVAIDFTFTSKVPALKSAEFDMVANKAGKLLFNAASPDNANQRTLDQEEKRDDDASV